MSLRLIYMFSIYSKIIELKIVMGHKLYFNAIFLFNGITVGITI